MWSAFVAPLPLILTLPCLVNARLGSNLAEQVTAKASALGRLNSNRSTVAVGGASTGTIYTQNSFCRTNNCINPVFPGLKDLPRLEALQWQCATHNMVKEHMDFCQAAVPYDPALPSPVSKATAVSELVRAQEDAAMTMFVYHLNGMGFDAWDNRNPSQSDSNCVRSIWKMVCYTYFPRAAPGCKSGEQSLYKRPCSSSCSNYVMHCEVECCDESVSCVFSRPKFNASGQIQLVETGYVDQSGPSAMCTGSAKHETAPWLLLLCILGFHWASATITMSTPTGERLESMGCRRNGLRKCCLLSCMVLAAVMLQGCSMDIPRHTDGNWELAPSYLQAYSYIPPGETSANAVLNSCSLSNVPATKKCSGRGYCKAFSQNSLAAQEVSPLAFCQCERDWADPECNTRRKSQTITFFLSLFLGPIGGDYFYLGFPLWATAKLFTLGGLGFWWLVDLVRTGSGPVYASDFRTAADLPHWFAMLILIAVALMIGFAAAIASYMYYRKGKRREVLDMQAQEESRHWKRTQADMMQFSGPRYRPKQFLPGSQIIEGPIGFSGYGATLPLPHPNAQVPYASQGPTSFGPPYAGPFGPSGVPGQGSPTPASIGVAPQYVYQ